MQGIRCERQVLWGLVGQVFPEYFQVFKDLGGETSRACLESCACAAAMRRITEEELIAKVRAVYTGNKLSVSKIRRAYRWAATSIGVAEGLQAIQLTVRLHLAQLQSLQAQMEQVTHAMIACLVSLPETPYLLSVKSLGAVSVALFLAEVADPSRYQTAAQWLFWPASNPPPTLLGRSSAVRPPCPTRAAPNCAPCSTLLVCACLVRSPLRSTLCRFTKEAQEPAHQDASPGCPDE